MVFVHVITRYDGQRAQIHKLPDGLVRVFSRNGDESTSRFPDVTGIIKESCKPNVETIIIDAEVRSQLLQTDAWVHAFLVEVYGCPFPLFKGKWSKS